MKKIVTSFFLILIIVTLLGASLAGCAPKNQIPEETIPEETLNPNLDLSEDITIRVVSPWKDFAALGTVADLFTKKYTNVEVVYEFVQDYYSSIAKRMLSGEERIDLFVTTNIQPGNALTEYALDLYTDDRIDLSQAFDGLVHNFEFRTQDESSKLYAVPLGAEIRGLFVNKTLLASVGLTVPENREQLLTACATLKSNGYIPMHGNPAAFGQQFLYPYICSLVANAENYDEMWGIINSRASGISEYFREPMSFLYSLVENGYYDYKYVQNELDAFIDTTNEGVTRDFFNIRKGTDGYAKVDDLGFVAFMPGPRSLDPVLAKAKSDYHSNIDYEFVIAPVGTDSGYAYLSPAHAIAINKNTEHLDWTIELLNYLYTPEINTTFADILGVIPNTENAYALIKQYYNISEDHVSQVGDVTFDYGFYSIIVKSLTEIGKANNPEYMQSAAEGTKTMYTLEDFMKRLELRLTGKLND